MLAYFPELYPDELLYSVIARYGVHTRQTNSVLLSSTLFDLDYPRPSVYLPIGLNYLLLQINPSRRIDFNTIVKDHTMFNYFYAFARDHHREEIIKQPASKDIRSSRLISLRNSLVKEPRHLRFCTECRGEMFREYGEAYWKRVHQLPLAIYCSKHDRFLVESPFTVASRYCASNALNRATPGAEPTSDMRAAADACKPHLMRLLDLSITYLSDHDANQPVGRMASHYRAQLQRKGLAISKSKVKMEAIEIRAKEHFKPLFHIWPDLTFSKHFRRSALMAPLLQGYNGTPSMYNILLQDFIAQQPDLQPEDDPRDVRALGSIDWPCLNPIADHKQKPKITVIRTHKTKEHSILRFTCECGYSYTQSRYLDGRHQKPKLVCFGPDIIPVIRKAQEENWSLRRIARKLKTNHKQVIVEAARYGIVIRPNIRRIPSKAAPIAR